MKRMVGLMVVLMLAACNGDADNQEQDAVNEEGNTEVAESGETEESSEVESEADNNSETSTESDTTDENNESEEIEQVEEDNDESEEDLESEENNSEVAETPEFTVREYSDEEKQAMVDEFYSWAVERAEIGAMAVTDYYFGHGAAGRGDWYASTPDGDVQAQDLDNPGFDAFDIHAIGGVVFYQPISGDYGADENTEVESTASGYQTMALDGTDIHKYMLADNGVVYEHTSVKEETSLSSGFGEYNDDGTRGEYAPTSAFEVSGDQDAQNEWQRILSEYQ